MLTSQFKIKKMTNNNCPLNWNNRISIRLEFKLQPNQLGYL